MKKRRQKKPGSGKPKTPMPKRLEVNAGELAAIIERAKSGPVSEKESEKLFAAIDTLAFLTQELEAKGTSIKRLRQLVFGARTEKTSKVVGRKKGKGGEDGGAKDKKPKGKRKGHGRNGADTYTGADKVTTAHSSLKPGEHCPDCLKGKVYHQRDPAVLVRVKGMAPLAATVYECERLRCNLCGEVFTAEAPEGVGEEKYDETAAAMIALMKYGCGLPFYRLERLEGSLGIPLPSSTQWEVVLRAAGLLGPAYEELIRQAAQGTVLHNDDTTARILEMMRQLEEDRADSDGKERTGIYTTGIVSILGEHKAALFFTGRRHAGENLADVLARRAAELSPPIQMSDGLAANTAGVEDTIKANCNSHGRRRFVDVVDSFPEECRHYLEEMEKVYKIDAEARLAGMSPEERLRYHQRKSKKVMDDLEKWLKAQLDEHKVEPNSVLGEVIRYVQKRWDKLTLFLRKPGAPLDNNIAERALKKAILHRKNALFYKTLNGARVGDIFMSFIHTCELNGGNPFEYLVALQRYTDQVAEAPDRWMPWNYQEALARLTEDKQQ